MHTAGHIWPCRTQYTRIISLKACNSCATSLKTTTQTQHQMQGALLLDVVVRKRAPIFQLLACKDQALLVRWDALLVLNLGFHIVNGVGSLHIQGDGLARQSLDKNLHATPM